VTISAYHHDGGCGRAVKKRGELLVEPVETVEVVAGQIQGSERPSTGVTLPRRRQEGRLLRTVPISAERQRAHLAYDAMTARGCACF
jgi:hypothetical protein